MPLSKESIQEFKKIYKEVFKEDISDQEALERGTRLINFVKLIYRVNTKEKLKIDSEIKNT